MSIKKIPQQLKSYLRGAITEWSTRKGIPNKIAHLNKYANDNPRQTIFLALGILLSLFFVSTVLTCSHYNEEQKDAEIVLPLNQIEDISSVIAGKQRIEDVKRQQTNVFTSLITEGQRVRKELDSLLALPVKSSRDSLEIVRKHKQLQIIVNNINEKDKF